MKNLKIDIANKNYSRVYIFYGEEDYLKNIYIEKIKKSLLKDDELLMNYSELSGLQVKGIEVIEMANTLPMFAQKRIIVIRNCKFFTKERKLEGEIIANLTSDINVDTVLIFVDSKIDKRGKLYKSLTKKGLGKSVEFKRLTKNELVIFIEKKFIGSGISCEKKKINIILERLTNEMYTVDKEINKLIDYVGQGGTIEKDMIETFITKSLEINIFELVDGIGNKNIKKSLDIYNNLVLMKEPPIKILTMIVRQIRILLQCAYLMKVETNEFEISREIEVNSYFISSYIRQSKNFTLIELYNLLKMCLDIDEKIKTGVLGDKMGVEILIVEAGA